MASGLVPMTSLISAELSLPPSSAGAICRRYGGGARESAGVLAEVVGVGLELHPHRRCRDDVVRKAVFVAISDRRILALEGHSHLGIGIAGAVPAGQRVGP